MLIILTETQRHIERMKWVSHAANFFASCIDGATQDDLDDAVIMALAWFNSGNSGARSVYASYDLIRKRAQSRNKN